MRFNKWKLSTIVLGILLIIISASFLIRDYLLKGEENLSVEQATEIALNYINKYLTDDANQVSLNEVSKDTPKKFYKFVIEMGSKKFDSYVSEDGKLLFAGEALNLDKEPEWAKQPSNPEADTQPSEIVEGNFKKLTEAEICKENDKPIVYFFGSEGCPHCLWEHPIIKEVTNTFKDYISFHDNMDSQSDQDIFFKYSNGSVPTLILGCKYYRTGSGESQGEEKEKEVLTKLVCDLAQNQPENICKPH